MMMMVATDPGQGLLLVSLSLVIKTAIIGRGAEAHLAGVWEMMLWIGPCAKFPSHHSHEGLKGKNSSTVYSTNIYHV